MIILDFIQFIKYYLFQGGNKMNKVNNQMTVREVTPKIAKWKGFPVAEQTVRSMLRRGQLKFTKRGGKIRISASQLESYFKKFSK